METSVLRWNSQQATADECNIMDHFELNSFRFDALDELTAEQYLVSSAEEAFTKSSLSSDCYTSFLAMDQENKINHKMTTIDISDHSFEPPTKQIKTDTWNSQQHGVLLAKDSSSPSSSPLISFANFSSQPTDSRTSCVYPVSPVLGPKDELVTFEDLSQTYNLDDKSIVYSSKDGQGTKRSSSSTILSRTPSHAQDRVIAERKRRERLTERFIALSAIIPGLKKLDKASVLGDAIKYLKHLQERVKLLEEQIKKKKPEESFVSLNTCDQLPDYDDDPSPSDVNSSGCLNKALPEIEARVSEKNVLIRIHCEKQKGFVPKMLSEIEKLHLIVINSNVLPFGDYALDVAVVAQMDDEFCLTVKDLVRNLRSALH